jgi:small subunit ribosomal protein S1
MSDDRNRTGSEDFGAILESYERQTEPAHGKKAEPRGRLVRIGDAPPPQPAGRYDKPKVDEDFAGALESFEKERGKTAGPPQGSFTAGQTVRGSILSLDLETAFVDLGAKSTAELPTQELTSPEGELLFKAGDEIDAAVVGFDRATGTPRLRLLGRARAAGAASAFGETKRPAAAELEVGQTVQGYITGTNKGGVEVEVGSKRGFCPISQLADHRVEDATPFVGLRYSFLITRIEEGGRNLVLSRRALLEAEKAESKAITLAGLSVGSILRGRITAMAEYGVFVELGGGLEGLVHVSELSFERLKHPQEKVAVGQILEVKVQKIEKGKDGRERISLSHKALLRDPWLEAQGRFHEGAIFRGTVRRLDSFGAFVELEPGVEGLVHISELGRGRHLNHPREVLKLGQQLDVQVKGLDKEKRRISLAPLEAGEAPDLAEDVRKHLAEGDKSQAGFGAMAAFFSKAKKG